MDSFTLVIASLLVSGTMALKMLLLYRASAGRAALFDWSLSGLFFFAGNIIGALATKYELSYVLAPALGNVFYVAGHAGILAGVRRHLALRPRYDRLVLLALAVLAMHLLPYVRDSVEHRLFLLTPVVAGINFAVVWLLWRQPDEDARHAYRPLMVLELLFGIQMGLRILYMLANANHDLTFMGSQFLQTSGTLFVLVFLSVVTMSCSLIVTHQQQQALRRASLTDALTGWLNRRALHDIARREFHRCRRTATPLTFLTFDIDHFKSINDRHGHGVGDAAIRHVTALSARVLRGYDAQFRTGGEEFAVLLDGAGASDVQRIAERLRELVAATPLVTQGLSVPMTVSVGVAAARPGDGQWEEVLKRADEAMYFAKKHGRNRVGIHGIDVPAGGAQAFAA